MIRSFTVVYRVTQRREMASLVRSMDLSRDLPALPQTPRKSCAQIAEDVLVQISGGAKCSHALF